METKITFNVGEAVKIYYNCYPAFYEGGNVLLINVNTHKIEDKIPDGHVKEVVVKF